MSLPGLAPTIIAERHDGVAAMPKGITNPPDLATLQKVEDSSGATHAVVPNMSDGAQRPQPVDGALCRRDSHIEYYGPEFTSKRLDQWAYLNGVELDFSRPGKPTDNAMIEAFNGERPHSALGNLAPETFALVATAGVQ